MPVKLTIQDLSEEKKQKNRAVIYARYSSERQNEQSIEGQLRECYAYAKAHGLTVVKEIADRQ